MEISIASSFDYNISIFKQIRMIADHYFSHLSLGGNLNHFDYTSETDCKKLAEFTARHSVKVDTIHSGNLNEDDSINIIHKSLQAAELLEAKTVVIHPVLFEINDEDYPVHKERIRANINLLQNLFITYKHIDIAVENVMPGKPTHLLYDALESCKDKRFGLCYDSSHEQIDGPAEYKLLKDFKSRIKAVHLSDRCKPFVDHQIPGEGFIDFDQICSDLKKAKFDKPILLEVMMRNSKFATHDQFLDEAKKAGDRIWKKIHDE